MSRMKIKNHWICLNEDNNRYVINFDNLISDDVKNDENSEITIKNDDTFNDDACVDEQLENKIFDCGKSRSFDSIKELKDTLILTRCWSKHRSSDRSFGI